MSLRAFREKTMPRSKQYPDRHVVLQRWVTYGLQYPGVPFSYALSKLHVSPNGVSVFRVLLNISVPLALLWWSTPTAVVTAVVALYAGLVTDVIDGQLARAYGTTTPEGHFMDSVTSASIPVSIFICAGVITYRWDETPYGLIGVAFILGIWGMTASSRAEVVAKERASKLPAETGSMKPIASRASTAGGSPPNLTSVRSGVKIVVRSPHFLLLRFAGAVALALVLSEETLVLYGFLTAELALTAQSEVRSAARIYRKKLITELVERP